MILIQIIKELILTSSVQSVTWTSAFQLSLLLKYTEKSIRNYLVSTMLVIFSLIS